MADSNNNDNDSDNIPPITGDFSDWEDEKLVAYLLSLNDPSSPQYTKQEFDNIQLNQLRAWATEAYKFHQYLQLQDRIPKSQKWIPTGEGKVHMPLGAKVDQILDESKRLFKLKKKVAQQEEKKSNDEKEDVDIEASNGRGHVSGSDNSGVHQQRQQGRKRAFEEYYAPMPDDEKYEKVTVEDAARFFAGGYNAVQSDVEQLMGIQFFKLKNGNGQVFYMRKGSDGQAYPARLHQKQQQRPLAYDSDDDIDDEGFQDQMRRDPFFMDRPGGKPPKKRSKVSFGHMVRYVFIHFIFICFWCAFSKVILLACWRYYSPEMSVRARI